MNTKHADFDGLEWVFELCCILVDLNTERDA